MEQELWRKVEELFHAALEQTPNARQTFLDGTCNGDIDLRRQVDLLLAREKQAASFLEDLQLRPYLSYWQPQGPCSASNSDPTRS
jgi:hypothetical protein